MPTISITRTYQDGQVLNESDLDTSLDAIETALNVTKIDSDNIQTAGIITASIADNAITKEKINSSALGEGVEKDPAGKLRVSAGLNNVVFMEVFS